MAEAQLQPQQDAPALQAPDGFELDKYFGDDRQRQSEPSEYIPEDPCRRFRVVEADWPRGGTMKNLEEAISMLQFVIWTNHDGLLASRASLRTKIRLTYFEL